jgi:peptidyl-prolyl cis-trans isomerase D
MGGDLDYFGRGAMVAEFDAVAWTLQPNQISDLVQSQFGFHIIKLTDRRAATTRTLDEVKPQLEEQIKAEKAQAEAARLAAELSAEIKTPADLDRVAAARKLTVGDSGLFGRDEAIAGLGFAPSVAAQAFLLEKDKVSGQISTGQAFVFIAVKEVVPPAMPALATVRDRVSQNVVEQTAVARAAEKAREMAQGARANFAAAAKAAGVAVKSTELITRGSALPEIGISPKVDDIAFKLAEGETSAPIEVGAAVVVVRVKARQPIDTAARDAARAALRDELAQQRQGAFFSAYMAKAMESMEIAYNNETVGKILGN